MKVTCSLSNQCQRKCYHHRIHNYSIHKLCKEGDCRFQLGHFVVCQEVDYLEPLFQEI